MRHLCPSEPIFDLSGLTTNNVRTRLEAGRLDQDYHRSEVHKLWYGLQEDIRGAGTKCILQRGGNGQTGQCVSQQVRQPIVQRPETTQYPQVQEELLKTSRNVGWAWADSDDNLRGTG